MNNKAVGVVGTSHLLHSHSSDLEVIFLLMALILEQDPLTIESVQRRFAEMQGVKPIHFGPFQLSLVRQVANAALGRGIDKSAIHFFLQRRLGLPYVLCAHRRALAWDSRRTLTMPEHITKNYAMLYEKFHMHRGFPWDIIPVNIGKLTYFVAWMNDKGLEGAEGMDFYCVPSPFVTGVL